MADTRKPKPPGLESSLVTTGRTRLARRPLTEPALCRLPADTPRRNAILQAHAAALTAGESGYLDPDSGLFVLTAGYLAARGRCCERGCRHCPYVSDAESTAR